MVTSEEIEKLAALARIELSSEEKEKLRGEVESILSYVSQIQEISEGGEKRAAPSFSGVPANVMREDASPHEAGRYTEALLAAAPERKGEYIRVKRIL